MNAVFVGSGLVPQAPEGRLSADDTLGFALAGLEVIACPDPARAETVLSQLGLRGDLGLVLLAQDTAAAAPRALAELERRKVPVLVIHGDAP